jgi:N-acetylmuramidase/Putative peptidoglycan binding domain
MTNPVPSQLASMQAITGTKWAPDDGPNETIEDWLKFIANEYPVMSRYCRAEMQLDYFEWCGLAVGYCIAKAGIKPVFGVKDTDRFLWALAWQEWGDAVESPEAGDVVVFDFGAGRQHVTLFEKDNGNGYWTCRGGNQSNQVKTSNFPKSCVYAIQRPNAAMSPAVVSARRAAVASISPMAVASRRAKSPQFSSALAAHPSAPVVFQGGGLPLTDDALAAAAQKLGCGVAEIWAIAFTETDPPYGGFLVDKRPQILFERHIFSRLTDGRFDAVNPNISNPRPGGYGAGGAHQHDRLSQAMGLDESAALQSASWGIGQVLGENYREAGFTSPEELARQVFASEDQQLIAVANEIVTDGVARALATHDWKTFARIYNGPNYAENDYDNRIRTWFEKFSSGASPDLRVRTAQVYLMYLGFDPSDIDGSFGKRTRSAMNEYQSNKGMPVTSNLDDATFAAIEADGNALMGSQLAAA